MRLMCVENGIPFMSFSCPHTKMNKNASFKIRFTYHTHVTKSQSSCSPIHIHLFIWFETIQTTISKKTLKEANRESNSGCSTVNCDVYVCYWYCGWQLLNIQTFCRIFCYFRCCLSHCRYIRTRLYTFNA